MKTELRELFAELVRDQPNHTIDLDREIDLGRRRVRFRQLGAAGLAAASVLALTGGIVAFRQGGPDASNQPPVASSPTPLGKLRTPLGKPRPKGSLGEKSTAKSAELATQLEKLVPEIAATPGGRRFNHQQYIDGKAARHLTAGVHWRYPAGRATDIVDLIVYVRDHDELPMAPATCSDLQGPPRCDSIVKLADGSTAYRDSYAIPKVGHVHRAWIERRDGTQIEVFSGAQLVSGSKHDTVLDADRVFEVAKQITAGW